MRLRHRLSVGRFIEVSAQRHGSVLRLRARLCEDDLVLVGHARDFDLSVYTVARAIDEFTAEFERIAGIQARRPLFPDDLLSLQCPAAPPSWDDPIVFGIAGGTPEQPEVVYLDTPEPLTPELIEAAEPCSVREIYRLASVCIKEGCRRWRNEQPGAEGDGACSLVQRVVAGFTPVVDNLPACGVRASCRWFKQEGHDACRVCPGIVTDLGELPQDPEREAEIAFF